MRELALSALLGVGVMLTLVWTLAVVWAVGWLVSHGGEALVQGLVQG